MNDYRRLSDYLIFSWSKKCEKESDSILFGAFEVLMTTIWWNSLAFELFDAINYGKYFKNHDITADQNTSVQKWSFLPCLQA